MYTYYFTDDLLNPKEIYEIQLLKREIKHLIIVTSTEHSIKGIHLHYVRLKKINSNIFFLIKLWMKLSYLFSKTAESNTDIFFPKRNFYSSNILTRLIVNIIWRLKKVSYINNKLPYYEDVCIFPIKLYNSIKNKKFRLNRRAAIVNLLIIHQPMLIVAINLFKISGFKIVASVKSWDNSFYTQIYRSADRFIVWGESMWVDIIKTHKLKNKKYLTSGPRIFDEFYKLGCKKYVCSKMQNSDIIIGYACAYGKEILGDAEIELIKLIAKKSINENLRHRFLIRPYPTVEINQYSPLLELPNITIQAIEGDRRLRYNFSEERINFGSPSERLIYLEKCDVFMSLGTTFTVEAAIYGLPIFHYYLDKNSRLNKCEKLLFERIDICDHILNYFHTSLPVESNLRNINHDFIINYFNNGNTLLNKLGVGLKPFSNLNNFIKN